MYGLFGYFRATKVISRLPFVKQYALYFLKDRVLCSVVGSHFVYEDGFNNIVSSEQLDKVTKNFMKISANDLLKRNDSNFEILYSEIRMIEMNNYFPIGFIGSRSGTLTIYTQEKLVFEIPPNADFFNCRKIVISALPDKIK